MTATMAAEAETLRRLFKQHATTTQADFGRENDIGSPAMVYQYLNARRPLGLLAGARFAIGLGVDLRSFSPRLAAELEWAQRALSQSNCDASQPADYARVSCVQLRLQPGKRDYKVLAVNAIGAFIAFRHDWLREREYESARLLALQMDDEGMRPTLTQGDLIVINTADVVLADAAVFAFNYEGDLQIRRIIRDAGSWWLYCDNPDMQRFPRKLFGKKRCYILGRVVHRQSETV
jgi:hypothetical protein